MRTSQSSFYSSLCRIPRFSSGSPRRLFGLAAACAFALASAQGAVFNVADYGATGNDSTDDFTAITNAVNASASGDTIYFPAGTYNVSQPLTIASNRTYFGQPGAILNMTGTSALVAGTNNPGTNVTMIGVTFQTGGLWFNNTPKSSNIILRNCTFQNIAVSQGALYINGASNFTIQGCAFNNIANTGITPYNVAGFTITDNTFNKVSEGMHLNGTCTNTTVARNTGVLIHRMPIEIQGSGYQNLLVEDNHFSNWDDPFYDSMGLSIVQNSGPNVLTQYNTLLARPAAQPPPHSSYACGIEIGFDELVQYNFVEGLWGRALVVGGGRTTVTNNMTRGTTPGYNTEPGYDGSTDVISNNTAIVTTSFINPPTGVTATNGSATQVALSWTNNDTAPTNIQVQRQTPGGMFTTLATLAGTATSYTDTTVNSSQKYVYRLHPYDAADETYSPVAYVNTRKFETESLTVPNFLSRAGGTVRALSDPFMSHGGGRILDSNNTGDYVTFLLPSIAAGTYNIKVGVKNFYSRGQFQLQCGRSDNFSSSAVNVGPVIDQYAANTTVYEYVEYDLGTWSPASLSDKWFRFNVVGKNAASAGSSYNTALCIDYISLTPQ